MITHANHEFSSVDFDQAIVLVNLPSINEQRVSRLVQVLTPDNGIVSCFATGTANAFRKCRKLQQQCFERTGLWPKKKISKV